MNILITGGAGYIGTELIYLLSCKKFVDSITIYDNMWKQNYNLFTGLRKIENNNINFIHDDILNTPNLEKAMKGIDCLIHLASFNEKNSRNNSHMFEQINNWGSLQITNALNNSNIKKVIYLSSQDVYSYGDVFSEVITKKSYDYYGLSKLRGEKYFNITCDSIDTMIIRCASVFGYSKNLNFDKGINKYMFDAHMFNRITIHGSQKKKKTFVDINTLTNLISSVLDDDFNAGTYNLSEFSLSISDIVNSLSDIYPSLETINVDQHMEFDTVNMDCNPKLKKYIKNQNFSTKLKEFKSHFTF